MEYGRKTAEKTSRKTANSNGSVRTRMPQLKETYRCDQYSITKIRVVVFAAQKETYTAKAMCFFQRLFQSTTASNTHCRAAFRTQMVHCSFTGAPPHGEAADLIQGYRYLPIGTAGSPSQHIGCGLGLLCVGLLDLEPIEARVTTRRARIVIRVIIVFSPCGRCR